MSTPGIIDTRPKAKEIIIVEGSTFRRPYRFRTTLGTPFSSMGWDLSGELRRLGSIAATMPVTFEERDDSAGTGMLVIADFETLPPGSYSVVLRRVTEANPSEADVIGQILYRIKKALP